jgi:small subunit ribosomal protein S29
MIRQKGESGLETEIYRAYGEDHGVAGQVVGLQDATVDALRASEAFKPTQGWGIFRRPGLLIRKESVELSKKLVDAQYDKSMVRLVLDGDRGTGKSLMLIHAMATAFTKGWIVLNIPEGKPCLS